MFECLLPPPSTSPPPLYGCPSACPSVRPSVWLSVCLCLSVCLSLRPSPSATPYLPLSSKGTNCRFCHLCVAAGRRGPLSLSLSVSLALSLSLSLSLPPLLRLLIFLFPPKALTVVSVTCVLLQVDGPPPPPPLSLSLLLFPPRLHRPIFLFSTEALIVVSVTCAWLQTDRGLLSDPVADCGPRLPAVHRRLLRHPCRLQRCLSLVAARRGLAARARGNQVITFCGDVLLLFVGCSTSQQHVSASHGPICSDSCTKTKVATLKCKMQIHLLPH